MTAAGATFTGPILTLGEPETASSTLAFARPSGNGLGQSGDYFGLRSFGAVITSEYLYLQNIVKGDATTPTIDARTYVSAQGWTDAGSGASTTLTEIMVRSQPGTSSITLTADSVGFTGNRLQGGNISDSAGTPSISSGSASAIAGLDYAFVVTEPRTGDVIAFGNTWSTAPVCSATNKTNGGGAGTATWDLAVTTTQVTINTIDSAGSIADLMILCRGY